MKVTLVSLNQIWENKEANLLKCRALIEKAKGVDLIIFPEMTLTGFTSNVNLAEDFENSWTIKEFQRLAQENDIAIIFGVILKGKTKAKNSNVFINNKGNILGIYTKIHPFSFADENKYFEAGNKVITVNFKGIKIGLTICYDLRFCNLYSLMDDCDMIVNIANWPAKRIKHWDTLLKARAIENQTYIIGVNRIGIDGNNLEYVESSKIFNANGDELEYKQIDEEIKIYEIDLNWNKKFKKNFNTVRDKRVIDA